MTVYFVMPIGDQSKVKIGTTTNLDSRMKGLACEFDLGIELLGVSEGGAETERVFHLLLQAHRIEGEWFRRCEQVDAVIEPFRVNVPGRRIWGKVRPVSSSALSALDEDKEIARDALKRLMDNFGAVQFGVALRRAYDDLAVINPYWTSRRVRAIWERQARRIDHFEIRDLEKAVEAYRGRAAAHAGQLRFVQN